MSVSRKPKGIDIPWFLIAFLFLSGAWPIGLFLLVLRELPIGKTSAQTSASAASQSTSSKTTSAKKKKEKKYKSGKTGVFRTVGIILLVLGFVSGFASVPEMLVYGFSAEAVQNFLMSLYLALGGGAAIFVADLLKKRSRDISRYAAVIGKQDSVSLMKISAATSHKLSKVKRGLQDMIDDGYFGSQAYIDHANLCFMRSPDAVPDGVAEQLEKSRQNTMSSVARDLGTEEAVDMSDYDSILKKIRRLDDDIEDEAVSVRIRRIESITRNIFHYVGDNPQKKQQIRTFMGYYLPTTLKLLESYSRIEEVGVAGQNMRDAKDNIEKILDMLVVGFEGQMDQLFKSESLDITSDIEVLEQMMNKDGLTGKDDFRIREEYTDEISDDLEEDGSARAVYGKEE
jgi:hypothetical protein